MKKEILTIFFLLIITSVCAQYEVRGGLGTPLLAESDTKNSINIYMLNSIQGATISFTSSSTQTHQWYRYKDKAINADTIPSVQNGNTSTITDLQDGYGYFVGATNDPATKYVWIIDYSLYLPTLNSLSIHEDENKCEYIKLLANIVAPALRYYTPQGVSTELRRTYTLKYTKMEWQEDSRMFTTSIAEEKLKGIVAEIPIDPPPLTNTDFVLTGDSYAQHFGLEKSLTTPMYEAIALDPHGYPQRDKEKADNEVTSEITDWGGSAPIDLTFTAYANEPVAALYIWKVFDLSKPGSDPFIRYVDKVLRYTFSEEGSFRVQLEVVDRQSICTDTTVFFNVTIGKSIMKIPNAFSPGSSTGVNDEFKVSYQSVNKFRCTIFNRWGTKLYQWEDPSKGWDGRVNGKLVPTGVYFYVIEWTDSKNKSKTEKGSINILRGKN